MKYPKLFFAACLIGAVLLIKDAARGSFVYTTQGDYCGKVVRNIGEQVDSRELIALQECVRRSDSIYRAIFAEAFIGVTLVGAAMVVFLRQRRNEAESAE